MVGFQDRLDPNSPEIVRDRHGLAVKCSRPKGSLSIRTCMLSRSLSHK